MTSTRTRAALHKSIQTDGFSEYLPTYRAQQYIDEAKERMGTDRWRKLNQEWDND